MDNRTKSKVMCMAAIVAGIALSIAVPVQGAKTDKTVTLEYLDPFDLSLTTYRVHLPSAKAASVSQGNAAAKFVEAAPPVTDTTTTADATTASSEAGGIEVVTISDVSLLSDSITELAAESSTLVIRVRVMVRIPFMPELRSPCTPIV